MNILFTIQHSSRMHTTCFSDWGIVLQRPPERDPQQRPLDRDPSDRELPWIETHGQGPLIKTPRERPPTGQRPPWTDTPSRNIRYIRSGNQNGSDNIQRPPLPPYGQNEDASENITSPQISFAGGNNYICVRK